MNKKMRQAKVTPLLTLVLLAGLVAVPIVLTWKEVRQERLNHALIAAVNSNNAAVVRKLLRQGADPNAETLPDDERSVWTRIWDTLRHRSDPNNSVSDTAWKESRHESALMRAVEWSSSDNNDDDNADTVKALTDAGANVNFRVPNLTGVSSHWNTLPAGTTPLIEAAGRGKWKAMEVLLARHADVNAADEFGNRALMYAASYRNAAAVKALLTRGANVNARDDAGETALFWVFDSHERVRHESGDIDIIEWVNEKKRAERLAVVEGLLRYGASVDCKNSRGDTLMSWVFDRNDKQLIRMLKQAAAKEHKQP